MEPSDHKDGMSHLAAQTVVLAVVERARELGVRQAVAVLDANGLLMAFCRMEGAPLISREMAQNKALTALFGQSARDPFARGGGDPALLASPSQRPRITPIGGGLPVVAGDERIGAIGVSGGTLEQDMACAQAGLAALRAGGFLGESAGDEGGELGERRAGGVRGR
ncbi:GlcG/HbpS family heme-binding protein [Nannocystis radixulma]|uniref:Heme-binding protein n=1 Tax=Nannocystis radixulma TaxID=2995305 RepID=A0ABT5B6D0_9BACT|nr:heme-binding protein [Nannocystis radixulma]MDC0669220.1 heme-binding protein [Nannocystis radixulma]